MPSQATLSICPCCSIFGAGMFRNHEVEIEKYRHHLRLGMKNMHVAAEQYVTAGTVA